MKVLENITDNFQWENDKHPSWASNEDWDLYQSTKSLVNKKTGKPMSNFQAYLLEGIYETHKRRDGMSRPGAWHKYEDHFMAVAMKSDFSGASFSKLALFSMFRTDLDTKFPMAYDDFDDDHKNDWSILYWPHNGEQVILKVLDENLEPTIIARWFFVDTNYSNFFNDIEELEDQADQHFLDKFFKEAYASTGHAPNYKKIDIETGETIIDIEAYKGEGNAQLPAVYPIPTVGFSLFYEKTVFESFKTLVDDSLVWSYKMYLRDGWNSEANLLSLYKLLQKEDYIVIHNYSSEIEFKAYGLPAVWALKYLGLLNTTNMDFNEDYDSAEYIGDWAVHLCKVLDEVGISKRKAFIDFLISDIESIIFPSNKLLSFSERMWIIIKTVYENYIGD